MTIQFSPSDYLNQEPGDIVRMKFDKFSFLRTILMIIRRKTFNHTQRTRADRMRIFLVGAGAEYVVHILCGIPCSRNCITGVRLFTFEWRTTMAKK